MCQRYMLRAVLYRKRSVRARTEWALSIIWVGILR